MEMRKIVSLLQWCSSFLLLLQLGEAAKNSDNNCGYCKYMVATFKQGLIRTENQHFAGGNTDWEERKLGKFKTSEIRFVEIMEHVCKKFDSDDSDAFDSFKDLQFKCNHMAEESEELLEKWFFKRQESNPNIFQYVCIDELRKCCDDGHYGPGCSPCPGALKGSACFGNGKCNGDGTREGTGRCECNDGYAGVRCSTCSAHYFATTQNDSHIECKACFDGCARGCTNPHPTGCIACRSGYKRDENLGCVDVNECETTADLCTKSNEECVNTQGHYNCQCLDGYRRNFDTDECEVDVHDPPDNKTDDSSELDAEPQTDDQSEHAESSTGANNDEL